GHLAVGYFAGIILAVISIVGDDVFGMADRVSEPDQGVKGGLELLFVVRGLADERDYNQVAIHINGQSYIVGLLPSILAGRHSARFGVGKVHLVLVSRVRLGRFWFPAADLLAGALLFFGPLGHPLFILGLFFLVAGLCPFFNHGLRLLYSGQLIL